MRFFLFFFLFVFCFDSNCSQEGLIEDGIEEKTVDDYCKVIISSAVLENVAASNIDTVCERLSSERKKLNERKWYEVFYHYFVCYLKIDILGVTYRIWAIGSYWYFGQSSFFVFAWADCLYNLLGKQNCIRELPEEENDDDIKDELKEKYENSTLEKFENKKETLCKDSASINNNCNENKDEIVPPIHNAPSAIFESEKEKKFVSNQVDVVMKEFFELFNPDEEIDEIEKEFTWFKIELCSASMNELDFKKIQQIKNDIKLQKKILAFEELVLQKIQAVKNIIISEEQREEVLYLMRKMFKHQEIKVGSYVRFYLLIDAMRKFANEMNYEELNNFVKEVEIMLSYAAKGKSKRSDMSDYYLHYDVKLYLFHIKLCWLIDQIKIVKNSVEQLEKVDNFLAELQEIQSVIKYLKNANKEYTKQININKLDVSFLLLNTLKEVSLSCEVFYKYCNDEIATVLKRMYIQIGFSDENFDETLFLKFVKLILNCEMKVDETERLNYLRVFDLFLNLNGKKKKSFEKWIMKTKLKLKNVWNEIVREQETQMWIIKTESKMKKEDEEMVNLMQQVKDRDIRESVKKKLLEKKVEVETNLKKVDEFIQYRKFYKATMMEKNLKLLCCKFIIRCNFLEISNCNYQLIINNENDVMKIQNIICIILELKKNDYDIKSIIQFLFWSVNSMIAACNTGHKYSAQLKKILFDNMTNLNNISNDETMVVYREKLNKLFYEDLAKQKPMVMQNNSLSL